MCGGFRTIVDVVNRLHPEVDLVVSGHTHQPYNCVSNGIPTTSACSFGRLVTDIDMRVDRATKDVTRLTINNRVVTRDELQAFEAHLAAAEPTGISPPPLDRITCIN